MRTIAEAAKALGINERTLKEWFDRGCPKTPGKYDLDAIHAWQAANVKAKYRERSRDPSDEVRGGFMQRKLEFEALNEEEEFKLRSLKRQQLAGELKPVSEISQEISAWAIRIRTQLMVVADRVAAIVPGESRATVKKIASDIVRLALKQAWESAVCGMVVEDAVLDEAERIRGERDGRGGPRSNAVVGSA